MKVSAYSYVRNGFQYDYPFIQAITSVLPLCHEFIMVVGDSTDGTREAIEALGDSRIRIVDTIWDEQLRTAGRIFAQQANIGLDHVTGDWAFHIQADEVLHEDDIPLVRAAMEKYAGDPEVEGFLFNFINFFGDYRHYGPSRRFHQHEIRITRNDPHVRSYRDSQGFRIFENPERQWEEKGRKLRVVPLEARIFHYSHVKNPANQVRKRAAFIARYESDEVVQKYLETNKDFNYADYDYLKIYEGTHPAVMKSVIDAQDWQFHYDPTRNDMSIKEMLMRRLEELTGKQFFIYKNYTILKK
ncbi:glycosyltransferase family 2 protein [Flavitalea sp. BT771]|uniref:glycosyltransferase n=1 Tax=Flavitalea sp. BT771 TaxID=3063329 RepID=UPI0026E18E3A|nr:glycosyltransferase [Flavitalea sp. BT771]MDO6435339.1 glycosyltransferase family 2 protein [Flavitalea sp. BT771]MDV6224301.1 glycosyltransferase family 2 protein [Flavitalea sp. BT771]